MIQETHCPLCAGNRIYPYYKDERRPYLRCDACNLVFVPTEWHLDRDQEKAQYDLHENAPTDFRYRQFLSRLACPLMERLPPGARGLDFGCGPGPTLSLMLGEAGFEVAIYDSFYAPDEGALAVHYDFITATEVVEHLRLPGLELDRLWSLLVPGGWLGIMTKLVRDSAAFASWHYKNDPTHICFYSADTWCWWAEQRGANLELLGADVILLQRPS